MIPDFSPLSDQQASSLDSFLHEMAQRGFLWTRSKTKDLIYTATKRPHKKSIVKLTLSKQGDVCLWLRFSASSNYSNHFRSKLIATLEEDGFKYVGCYAGCIECDTPIGYHVDCPQGHFFRCHKELINVGPIELVPIGEALSMIDTQHNFESAMCHKEVRV